MPHTTNPTSNAKFDFSPMVRELCQGWANGLAGVSQVQLSLCARVSPATVSRWANGSAQPTVEDLMTMRDCVRLPSWFRQACAGATTRGQAAGVEERSDLDADRDGKITIHDAEMFDARKQEVAAQRRMRMEEEEVHGHLTPDDLAEQHRLERVEESLSHKAMRVLEIVSSRPCGVAV